MSEPNAQTYVNAILHVERDAMRDEGHRPYGAAMYINLPGPRKFRTQWNEDKELPSGPSILISSGYAKFEDFARASMPHLAFTRGLVAGHEHLLIWTKGLRDRLHLFIRQNGVRSDGEQFEAGEYLATLAAANREKRLTLLPYRIGSTDEALRLCKGAAKRAVNSLRNLGGVVPSPNVSAENYMVDFSLEAL